MNPRKFLVSVLLFGLVLMSNFAISQCEITAADSYLLTDDPVTLTATPDGGFFVGPGITGDIFDPAAAGEGVHTITYVVPESGTGDIFYIQSNEGDPWGTPTNQTLMDIAFGPTSWNLLHYETLDPDALFSPTTGFVYMDGGSFQASELAFFLTANITAIEDWVEDGGRLFINSAPNEGSDIDFGFDGVTLNYEPGSGTYANNAEIIDSGHCSVFGPQLPVSIEMTGTYFSHGTITGPELHTIVVNSDDPDRVILAEKNWGAGRVMFGGMVAHNFQEPAIRVENWRANLLFCMYNEFCTTEITVGGYASISIEEKTQLMYPNPATETVLFSLQPETTVEIFSIAGNQILAPTLNPTSFDVSTIETGVYLVVFSNDMGKSTQRLVVR
jgi:hypothetical protein